MPDSRSIVLENRDLGGGVWLLRFRDPVIAADAGPGQFVMITCGEPLEPLILRRPFSIQRVVGDVYDVLYRVVGEGTSRMAGLVAGDGVQVLGPLGNTFTLPQPDETAVLLGGGVGIPPMVALADALEAAGHTRWEAYVGVSGTSDEGCFVGFDERWRDDPRVRRATMDGSIGFEGHVVAAWLDRGLAGPTRAYACGPMVMLRAVAEVAEERAVPAEVSVETMMGCGVGACMSCVIENRAFRDGDAATRAAMSPYDRWLLACRKGPVFPSQRIVLDGGEFLH